MPAARLLRVLYAEPRHSLLGALEVDVANCCRVACCLLPAVAAASCGLMLAACCLLPAAACCLLRLLLAACCVYGIVTLNFSASLFSATLHTLCCAIVRGSCLRRNSRAKAQHLRQHETPIAVSLSKVHLVRLLMSAPPQGLRGPKKQHFCSGGPTWKTSKGGARGEKKNWGVSLYFGGCCALPGAALLAAPYCFAFPCDVVLKARFLYHIQCCAIYFSVVLLLLLLLMAALPPACEHSPNPSTPLAFGASLSEVFACQSVRPSWHRAGGASEPVGCASEAPAAANKNATQCTNRLRLWRCPPDEESCPPMPVGAPSTASAPAEGTSQAPPMPAGRGSQAPSIPSARRPRESVPRGNRPSQMQRWPPRMQR